MKVMIIDLDAERVDVRSPPRPWKPDRVTCSPTPQKVFEQGRGDGRCRANKQMLLGRLKETNRSGCHPSSHSSRSQASAVAPVAQLRLKVFHWAWLSGRSLRQGRHHDRSETQPALPCSKHDLGPVPQSSVGSAGIAPKASGSYCWKVPLWRQGWRDTIRPGSTAVARLCAQL